MNAEQLLTKRGVPQGKFNRTQSEQRKRKLYNVGYYVNMSCIYFGAMLFFVIHMHTKHFVLANHIEAATNTI